MAELAKTGTPSLSTSLPCDAHRISGLLAGEAIKAGDACLIDSNGKVKLSSGAADTTAAAVLGFAATDAANGESVTLYHDVNFVYGNGVTPGAFYYLSATVAGGLSTVATTGGTVPIAFGLPDGRLRVLRDLHIGA